LNLQRPRASACRISWPQNPTLLVCALACARLAVPAVRFHRRDGVVPFAVTLVFAMKDRSRSGFPLSGKIGLANAILSLGLIAKPVSDGFTRSKQERNRQMRDVAAPVFETADLSGNRHRLED